MFPNTEWILYPLMFHDNNFSNSSEREAKTAQEITAQYKMYLVIPAPPDVFFYHCTYVRIM